MTQNFHCHGITFSVRLFDERFQSTLNWLMEDLQHFVVADTADKVDLVLEIRSQTELGPDSHQKKHRGAIFKTKMCRAYGFSKRLCVYDDEHQLLMKNSKLAILWGDDPHVTYEIAWTFLISMISEKIEKKNRWLRIHALGLNHPQGKVVYLSPSGGGKSFLAAQALQNQGQILSDEILWTDGKKFYPFPLRIALKNDSLEKLNLNSERKFSRKVFESKNLFPLPAPSVGEAMIPQIVFLGNQGKSFSLKPGSFSDRMQFYWVASWGFGLPQMREFMIRGENIFWLPRLFVRRWFLSSRVLSSTPLWTLSLEKDSSRNFEKLMNWMKNSFKL